MGMTDGPVDPDATDEAKELTLPSSEKLLSSSEKLCAASRSAKSSNAVAKEPAREKESEAGRLEEDRLLRLGIDGKVSR